MPGISRYEVKPVSCLPGALQAEEKKIIAKYDRHKAAFERASTKAFAKEANRLEKVAALKGYKNFVAPDGKIHRVVNDRKSVKRLLHTFKQQKRASNSNRPIGFNRNPGGARN